jgi:murein tripeptide amidase MpaA
LLTLVEIHIVPMINPDGVISGNSRTNLAGVDLNRKWGDKEINE